MRLEQILYMDKFLHTSNASSMFEHFIFSYIFYYYNSHKVEFISTDAASTSESRHIGNHKSSLSWKWKKSSQKSFLVSLQSSQCSALGCQEWSRQVSEEGRWNYVSRWELKKLKSQTHSLAWHGRVKGKASHERWQSRLFIFPPFFCCFYTIFLWHDTMIHQHRGKSCNIEIAIDQWQVKRQH